MNSIGYLSCTIPVQLLYDSWTATLDIARPANTQCLTTKYHRFPSIMKTAFDIVVCTYHFNLGRLNNSRQSLFSNLLNRFLMQS